MTPASLLRGALLAGGLLLTAACSAHNDNNASATVASATAGAATVASEGSAEASATARAPATSTHFTFTEGDQYATIKLPAGQAAPTGPVELVEAFSYGCPHCAEFAPYMDKLRAGLPKGVAVRYMPVVFNADWMPYAQAFYAAQQLGALARTHDAFFQAMLEHYPLNSLQDMAAWYGRHGVDPQKFLAAAGSARTMQQMAADQKTEIGWGVDSTPTLVVGRRTSGARDAPFVALMRSANFGNYDELQQLGLWMVQRVEQH